MVPTMLQSLLEKSNPYPNPQFSPNLRLIFLGGSHASRSLIRQIIERKLPVVLTYGMTESCSQVAIGPPLLLADSFEFSYREMFPTIIAIRSDLHEKDLTTNRSGRVGEILLRGPTIFRRYWNNPKATLSAIKDGWFYTGDLGYKDSQGCIVVLGRETDMIISGGENIHPIEVESILLEHEAIEDVIVIGKDDPKWGQRVEAVLKIKEGFNRPSASELSEFLGKKIGRYKIPKVYHFLTASSFPKTYSGKTKRTREIVRELTENDREHNQPSEGDVTR
jgi:O-succinylbenzoic acid--CoA ligase